MATIVGSQTITVGTEELTLAKSWVPKYHNELKKGNTLAKKGSHTEGSAVLRISHQVSKGIEGHVISLEVEGPRTLDGVKRLVKAQVVVTCEADITSEETLAADVLVALCGYIPTVVADIFADLTD